MPKCLIVSKCHAQIGLNHYIIVLNCCTSELLILNLRYENEAREPCVIENLPHQS